jgi:cytochrome o ubiquinol oxidase subunit 1
VESWGKAAFWCWLIGFYLAFMPLYVMGLMGATRRLQHYDVAAWYPWMLVAELGIILVWIGIACQIRQIVVSFRRQEELRDVTGDPWNGRSLEWSTASPPPAFNFAVLPLVVGRDAYWIAKQRAIERHSLASEPAYKDIEVPRNSPTGFVCAFFGTFLGFAMIWHIWWLAILSFIGAFATFVAFAWRDRVEDRVPAAEVARIDRANRSARLAALAHLGAAE